MRSLKIFFIGTAVLLLATGVFIFKFSYKTEKRIGYLEYRDQFCLLSPIKRPMPEVECDLKRDSCKSLYEYMLTASTDGLEDDFCKNNSTLIGVKVEISGRRVSGEAIGQDCSNRSCFKNVSLVEGAL